MSTMNVAPSISDPALDVHRNWCEPTNCRADRAGADNDGRLEAIVHLGAQYGFVTEPEVVYGSPEEITVQLEEFNNQTDPAATSILLNKGGETIELGLYDLQRLKHLLLMAEDDLIKAMDEQEARNGE